MIKRIIGLPFFAIIALIGAVHLWLVWCRNFLLYGGEAIAYNDKNEKKTIKDIYNLLKNEKSKT